MDTKEFLATSYPELAELLRQGPQGTIPEPQPIEVSPWLCQSLLQKSIRRGETQHAMRAAASLLRDDPDKLWRRLAVAVFEDIGLGSLNLIMPVLIGTSAKGIRQKFGGDWIVASALVESMAAARKCRAADDLLMTALAHPSYEADRLGLTYRTQRELMEIATRGKDDIIVRAIATIYAVGTDRFRAPTMRTRKGDPRHVFHAMREAGFPFTVVTLCERGLTRFREPLSALMSLVSRDVPARSAGFQPTTRDDDVLPTTMIGEVPGWCADWFTRPGRAAIRAFLKHETPTGRWIGKHVAPRDRAEFLGGLVFRVEGGLLRRRLQWPTGQYLRRVMEIEANGFGVDDATEILDLLRNDLPVLHEERCHVL